MNGAPIGGDLAGYYRLHAPLYDWTRPLFLFGRRRLLRELVGRWRAMQPARAPRVLEIGCGTGSNLAWLRGQLPRAQCVGIDLAPAMLDRARQRLGADVLLLKHPLGQGSPVPAALSEGFDLVVLSYVLSMTGDAREAVIAEACRLLRPGGLLGAVDFWSTPWPAFASWMARNHVRFDPAPAEALTAHLRPQLEDVRRAFGGVWRYGLWVGRR